MLRHQSVSYKWALYPGSWGCVLGVEGTPTQTTERSGESGAEGTHTLFFLVGPGVAIRSPGQQNSSHEPKSHGPCQRVSRPKKVDMVVTYRGQALRPWRAQGCLGVSVWMDDDNQGPMPPPQPQFLSMVRALWGKVP